MESLLWGKPYSFWVELDKRLHSNPDSVRISYLLQEVVKLRGKVSYYESRVQEMAKVIGE